MINVLRLAAEFTTYSHECRTYDDVDKDRHAYWSDILHKRLKLKTIPMSNLSDKTAYAALVTIARMVKDFEKLHYQDMTATDDRDATHARNLLEGIVQSNGYKVNYGRNSKKSIIKTEASCNR